MGWWHNTKKMYGVDVLLPVMILKDDPMYNWDTIDRYVQDGRRAGKCPWSCSMVLEGCAEAVLSQAYGITEKETMEETIERHRKEREKQGGK